MTGALRCSVEGCERKYMAASLCSMHYSRRRRHGSVGAPPPPKPPARVDVSVRFMSKVDVRGENDCWNWTAGTDADGYGIFHVDSYPIRATHYALKSDGKPRPDGAMALHSCDNPACVNPAHLRWGSQLENEADKISRGRNVLGERQHSAKLTSNDVRIIRNDNRPDARIAAEYGVCARAIWNVKTGKTWRHVA